MKILFIGGGKMMQAIAGGLTAGNASEGYAGSGWHVVEPDAATRGTLQSLFPEMVCWESIAADIPIDKVDIVVLGTKPQTLRDAIAPLRGRLTHQVVISIAAGVRIAGIARWLGGYSAIVRTMPNTPALIHAGVTGMFAHESVAQAQKANAQKLLAAIGITIWFTDESKLDAVTAVSGSGPAYVFYLIETLENIARELGLEEADAHTFAIETFRGAALLAHQSTLKPAELRANVTSKRGTTEAAIAAFDRGRLRDVFAAGVKAAEARSRELGNELSEQ